MDKTETPISEGWIAAIERGDITETDRKVIVQQLRENADLRRQLAAERGRVVEVLRGMTGVGDIALSTKDDCHSWVSHAKCGDPELENIVWCQYCGRHRSEIKDWTDNPVCNGLTAIRALADPQQTGEGFKRTVIRCSLSFCHQPHDLCDGIPQQTEQNAEGREFRKGEHGNSDGLNPSVGQQPALDTNHSGVENPATPAPSAPERDALVKRDGRAPTRRTLQTHAAKMLWLAQNTDRRCGGDRRFNHNGGRVRLGINGLLDAIAALSPAGVVVPLEPGWYWLSDNDGERIVEVFKRPGHEYLAIEGYTPLGGKRDFLAVEKMPHAKWFGPIHKPALLTAAAKEPKKTIDDLLDAEGFNEVCENCKYFSTHTEHHPYGSTTAAETLAECLCENDNDCPRLK